MPIYEYECTACASTHEILQKLSDAPVVECPQCHQTTLVKKVSAAAFRLKGGGWYETDFKNKKESKLANDSNNKTSESSDIKTKPENTNKIERSKSV